MGGGDSPDLPGILQFKKEGDRAIGGQAQEEPSGGLWVIDKSGSRRAQLFALIDQGLVLPPV